ncbi:MAG: Y-family DNA polymerase [Bdellovibrionales bacterium]|nr:Y-family DNA polymerase [Bdellovibrionales bacterium]
MKYVGLVDCNSFYCSCERVFRPEFRGKPVVVLSNNDGCAIAFTKEAKAVGFGEMCEPFFQIQDRIKKYNVAVFSSNYTLYDNFSRRVMNILRDFTPHLEIYSVDEAFLEFEGFDADNFLEYGKKIRSDILQFTGIPVGVGISKTKVLSKMANKLSKKHNGVLILKDDDEIDRTLKTFPVKDIWGIGRAGSSKLNMLGIKTAYDFKMYKNEQIIQKLLTKTGRQIQDELRGINCLSIEDAEDKKNTGNSRSFGSSVYSKRELQEALAEFCTNSAEKLRAQNSVCYSLTAYIHTNPFRDGSPQYYGVGSKTFVSGTSDTLRIIKGAHEILDDIFKLGYEYKKGGVLLNHIVPRNQNQMDLFDERPDDNEKLGQVVDLINKRYGSKTIQSAACGSNQAWRTIANFRSPKYTTSWKELLRIKG